MSLPLSLLFDQFLRNLVAAHFSAFNACVLLCWETNEALSQSLK